LSPFFSFPFFWFLRSTKAGQKEKYIHFPQAPKQTPSLFFFLFSPPPSASGVEKKALMLFPMWPSSSFFPFFFFFPFRTYTCFYYFKEQHEFTVNVFPPSPLFFFFFPFSSIFSHTRSIKKLKRRKTSAGLRFPSPFSLPLPLLPGPPLHLSNYLEELGILHFFLSFSLFFLLLPLFFFFFFSLS